MGRFRRGWELTKRSWGVLRSHPSLMRFPVFGALATLLPAAFLVLPGIFLLDTKETAPGVALVAIGLYLAVFVSIFFSVALAAAADAVFHGREAEANAEGYRAARSRLGPIAGWSLVSAVLGLLFAILESQRGLASIVGALLGAAWGLVTFLAVPVIAIEATGPITTIRRSATLFKQRWAGQITGNVAIGGAVGLFGILPSILLIAAGIYLWADNGQGDDVALGAVLVGAGAVILLVAVMLQRALRGVFGVALYRYAAEGEVARVFTADELESAVAHKA
jgi:hypothetical protein